MGRTNAQVEAHSPGLAAAASFLVAAGVTLLLASLGASAAEADPGARGTSAAFEEGASRLRRCTREPLDQCDLAGAIDALKRAVEQDPEEPRALALYAQALLAASRAEESLAVLERLGAVDPRDPDLEYFRGLASYRRKDWAAARVDLDAALVGRPDDPVLRLLLGVTNAELGDVDVAREHFEVAKREPTLVDQASYRLGLLEMRENESDQAREHFTAVGRSTGVLVRSELADSAAEYLSRLDEREFRRWDLNLTLGAGYDSNVTLTDDSSLTSGTSAGLGVVRLGGSYRLYDEGGYSLRVAQLGYFKFHTTLTEFDLQISESSLVARVRLAEWVAADLRYTFQFAAVDWDSFRNTHAVEPAFVLSSAWNIQARPYLRYERRNYDDIGVLGELLDRDGNVYTPGVDLFYTLPWFAEGSSWVRLGYRYRKESARSDEFDSEGHEPIVALGLALPLAFFLTLEGRYQWREYDSPSLFDAPGSSDQSDRIRVFGSSIRRKFGRHLSAEIFYRYTDRGSNVAVYRYRRSQVQLLVTYHF